MAFWNRKKPPAQTPEAWLRAAIDASVAEGNPLEIVQAINSMFVSGILYGRSIPPELRSRTDLVDVAVEALRGMIPALPATMKDSAFEAIERACGAGADPDGGNWRAAL